MASLTGAQVVSLIRNRADTVGTARHTDANLLLEFNQAMRRIRMELFEQRSPVVVATAEDAQTGATGPSTGWPGTILALGTQPIITAVRSIRAYVNSRWRPLRERPEDAVADWQAASAAGSTGPPEAYAICGFSSEQVDTDVSLDILILPAMDQLYTFQITYLAEWTEMTVTDDVNVDIPGAVDAAVWEVCRLVAIRDKQTEEAAIAQGEALKAFQLALRAHRITGNRAPKRRRPVTRFHMRRSTEEW